jgi:Flp pilus assembly protein TadB
VTAICGIVLFGLSASQTQSQLQNGNQDQCTDLTKGGFKAVMRPSRWILTKDEQSSDANSKYNYCPWKSINNGLRMSLTMVTFLSAVFCCYCLYVVITIPVFIHAFIMFFTGMLLCGTMCFDADDVRTSKEWCESGKTETQSPSAGGGAKCDYSPYVTTILVEVGVVMIFMAFSFFLFRHFRDMRRAVQAYESGSGIVPGGVAKAQSPISSSSPSAPAPAPAPAI